MSTQTRRYKQLTQGQRYQIEALLEKGHFQNEIAEVTGISESALSRELKRNTGTIMDIVLNQLINWLCSVGNLPKSTAKQMNDKCLS